MKTQFIMSIAALSCSGCSAGGDINEGKPNFVVIFCDDMGYGDLSCYAHPSIETPCLDQMAADGQRWNNFLVSASVSSPSRAGLLTGRYSPRTGMYGTKGRVLHPYHTGGMPESEKTLAEYLKDGGYTTACVGKWHLGHHDGQLPLDHGFDYFCGIPYSNDMSRREKLKEGYKNYPFDLPFYSQDSIVGYELDQSKFTEKFTDYSIDYIRQERDNPFFLYLAYTMPHYPLYPGEEFEGESKAGIYGDVIEEIDWSVGRILDEIKAQGLDENTIVVFTSDNGPWLAKGVEAGLSGPFRDGKSSQFEGGFRVPCIFWGGGVKEGVVTDMGSTLDLLPTFCNLAGVPMLEDRVYDGYDLTKTLMSGEESPRDTFFYYIGKNMHAVRKGGYKLHFRNLPIFGIAPIEEPMPLLYNLDTDIGEQFNIADQMPEKVAELLALAKSMEDSFTLASPIFDARVEANIQKK